MLVFSSPALDHYMSQSKQEFEMPFNAKGITKERYVRDIGIHLLEMVKSFKQTKKTVDRLVRHQFSKEFPEDSKIWLTCVLALKAVSTGNFGIGALITNGQGKIVVYGHNEVFSPYFRSDRHAEMVVLDQLEDENRIIRKFGAFALYTSLEPCPMCLARLITCGIGVVKYAAADPTGGMVHLMKNLPDVWIELSAKRTFTSARCSGELSEIAKEIFLLNVDELNKKLAVRSA